MRTANKIFWCNNCVNLSSRPRLEFKGGTCSACLWHKEKQKTRWELNKKRLINICDKNRKRCGHDVIVPCSGGKDGTYVYHKLKHEFGMNPLCITVMPQIQTRLGKSNLDKFIKKIGRENHILLTPPEDLYRQFAADWFINRLMIKQPFVTGISTSILQKCKELGIFFVMWGEQGEAEYGGITKTYDRFDRDFLINVYYEGQDPSHYGGFWSVPSQDDLDKIYSTWWSIWEDWEPEEHAKLAKDLYGFEMLVGGSIGTFTNYSQLDDICQDFHVYGMFRKFGFGRCTSDASIEIRRGRMTRGQGVEVVRMLDGQYPVEFHNAILDYLGMTDHKYWEIIRKHTNFNILRETENIEKPAELISPCA